MFWQALLTVLLQLLIFLINLYICELRSLVKSRCDC